MALPWLGSLAGDPPTILVDQFLQGTANGLSAHWGAQPPVRRTPPDSAGGDGSPCSGSYQFDFQALIQSGTVPSLTEGTLAFAQFWHRDPGDPFGVGFTHGLFFKIWP